MEAVDGPMNTTLPLIEGLPERCKTKLAGVVTNVTELARRELEAVTLSHLLAPANGRLDH